MRMGSRPKYKDWRRQAPIDSFTAPSNDYLQSRFRQHFVEGRPTEWSANMDAFEMEEWNPDVLPAETDADRLEDPLTASTLNHSAGPHHDINSDFLSDRPLRDTADYNFAESGGKSRVKLSKTADMSRRPRGPPGNAPHGGLKGATWEQDPNLIPDYAPSELFPVRLSLCIAVRSNNFPAPSQFEEVEAIQRARKAAN